MNIREVDECAGCHSRNVQWDVEGSSSGWFAQVECLDCGLFTTLDSYGVKTQARGES